MGQKTIKLHYVPSAAVAYCKKMVEINAGKENEKMMKDIYTLVQLAESILQKKEEK